LGSFFVPKTKAAKTGAKFTRTEREAIKAKVAKLDRRGWNQFDIANECKVSQPMVCMYLKTIRTEYNQRADIDLKAAIGEKLAQYREVRQEAWLAWERSKKNAKSTVEEKALRINYKKLRGPKGQLVPDGEKMKIVKELVKIEGRLPANAYLGIVVDCLLQESKLLGLLDPDLHLHLHSGDKGGGIDWEAFRSDVESPRAARPNSVEDELSKPLPDHQDAVVTDEGMEPIRMIPAPDAHPPENGRGGQNGDGHG
jgi:predicted transcriptional regulator